jgi:hypothetical protein
MDIVVGYSGRIQPSRSSRPMLSGPGESVEAHVLNVRPGRSGREAPPSGTNDRRREERYQDPSSGSVLMLLIPDGTRLPKDFGSGHYRVFVRISNK